jgi:hypothetical protein
VGQWSFAADVFGHLSLGAVKRPLAQFHRRGWVGRGGPGAHRSRAAPGAATRATKAKPITLTQDALAQLKVIKDR